MGLDQRPCRAAHRHRARAGGHLVTGAGHRRGRSRGQLLHPRRRLHPDHPARLRRSRRRTPADVQGRVPAPDDRRAGTARGCRGRRRGGARPGGRRRAAHPDPALVPRPRADPAGTLRPVPCRPTVVRCGRISTACRPDSAGRAPRRAAHTVRAHRRRLAAVCGTGGAGRPAGARRADHGRAVREPGSRRGTAVQGGPVRAGGAAARRAPPRGGRRVLAHPAGRPEHRLPPGITRCARRPGAAHHVVAGVGTPAVRRLRHARPGPLDRAGRRVPGAEGRRRAEHGCVDPVGQRPVDRRGDPRPAPGRAGRLPHAGQRRAVERARPSARRLDRAGPRAGGPGGPRPRGPFRRCGPVQDRRLVHHDLPGGVGGHRTRLGHDAQDDEGTAAGDTVAWPVLRNAALPRRPRPGFGRPAGHRVQLPRPVRPVRRALPWPAHAPGTVPGPGGDPPARDRRRRQTGRRLPGVRLVLFRPPAQ